MTNPDYSNIHIETTLPKSWEEEQTFNDILYDWMGRAPWLALSAAAHLVVFLIIMAIPWNLFEQPEEIEIQASIEQPPEEIFEDPPEEEEEEIIEEEIIEEPVIQDVDVVTEETEEVFDTEGDPDMFADSPFDDKAFNNVIGIGGGAGGKFGGRFGKKRGGTRGGAGTEQALKDGLEWLKRHQASDGSWDCDGFMDNCVTCPSEADGAGQPDQDVGVTGLALLAFLGDGNTLKKGPYKEVVSRGIKWLRQQQDHSGLIGEHRGHHFIYNHGIATLAISEAYFFSKSPLIRNNVQKAVDYIHEARDRDGHGTWRYDVPSLGDSDTSITGWMVFALKSAEESGIDVEKDALTDSLLWIEEVTDDVSGRIGYNDRGGRSSRVQGLNSDYPVDKTESMTAVGLLCRVFLGQTPKDTPIMKTEGELLLKALPEYKMDGDQRLVDWYYWYYGSYAMYQLGGKYWKGWQGAMERAVVKSQRHDGDFKGSWDLDGPWAHSGGRVYTTALGVLCLEVYFRYAQVLGAR